MNEQAKADVFRILNTPKQFERILMPYGHKVLAVEALREGQSAGAVTRRHAAKMLRDYRNEVTVPGMHELVRRVAISQLPGLVEKVAARMEHIASDCCGGIPPNPPEW